MRAALGPFSAAVFLYACQTQGPSPTQGQGGLTIAGATLVDTPGTLAAQKLLLRDASNELRLDDRGALRRLSTAMEVTPDVPERMARAALGRLGPALGLGSDVPAELLGRFVHERTLEEDDGATHVRLRQVAHGVPVDDRVLDVHFVARGSLMLLTELTGSPAPDAAFVPGEAKLDAAQAETLARAAAGEAPWDARTALRYYRDGEHYVLAYAVDLVAAALGREERLWIDAADGHVRGRENRAQHGSAEAFLYPISNVHGSRAWVPLANLSVSQNGAVKVSDTEGAFGFSGNVELGMQGPFVRVQNEDQDAYAYQGQSDVRLEFEVLDKRTGELAAFYFLNRMHDYFKGRFGYTKLDRPIVATVHVDDCLFNAYAHGSVAVSFGDGCGLYDYAQNADYVYHEYTHLVTNSIVDLDYSTRNEAGAFSEGSSDYFTCSFTDDPQWGENPAGIYTRKCDNDYRYEQDYDGESHNGGQLYAGSVWDLRKEFGASVADALAFYGLYYMPKQPTLLDTRDAILAADRAKFQGAHQEAIRGAFDRHGLNDTLRVFVTHDQRFPATTAPFTVQLGAHAQGFDRSSVRYDWTFGDGSTASGDEISKTFSQKPYTAKVTVRDASGKSQFAEITLSGCNATGRAPWPSVLALVALGILARHGRRQAGL